VLIAAVNADVDPDVAVVVGTVVTKLAIVAGPEGPVAVVVALDDTGARRI